MQTEKLRDQTGWVEGRTSTLEQTRKSLVSAADFGSDCLLFFRDQLESDLNTAGALTFLDMAMSERTLADPDKARIAGHMDRALGLSLRTVARADLRVRPVDAQLDEDIIEARLTERREARAAKDFARSDAIRDVLIAAGVEVMDGDPLGWDWKLDL